MLRGWSTIRIFASSVEKNRAMDVRSWTSHPQLGLRRWLVEQVDSHRFPGLVWEDESKRTFRIPWKHASTRDFCVEEHSALFKAWAEYRGHYREGLDQPDPSTWKTRLRCALKKSSDFEELPEQSRTNHADPYKVYRVKPETIRANHDRIVGSADLFHELPDDGDCMVYENVPASIEESLSHVSGGNGKEEETQMSVFVQTDKDLQMSNSISGYPNCDLFTVWLQQQLGLQTSFFDVDITFYYRGQLAKRTRVQHPAGCRIGHGNPAIHDPQVFGPQELQQVVFPPIEEIASKPQRVATEQLLGHLERGLLLLARSDGLYGQRLCRGRLFWSGPCAPHLDRPNKMERDTEVRLFDYCKFTEELTSFIYGDGSPPEIGTVICFGEEYPDTRDQKKLITICVEPTFARHSLEYAQNCLPIPTSFQLSTANSTDKLANILKWLSLSSSSSGSSIMMQ
uniref:interferon regulatory factor 8-like n=1 Tax=Myxine glutinosa TaxID=7769 RepID=UPI00358F48AF